jgi:hypothetical protein
MTDLEEREEGIDEILRASGPRLRAAVSQSPVAEFRTPRSTRRRSWIIAIASVVVLIVGLVAIGTNRNDQSQGDSSSRLYWQLTDLPDDFALAQMSEPGSQNGPPGATVMVNVYATDAAPLGPILSVSGSLGAGLDIVPIGGTNFEETTIGGRRAAFADGGGGARLLYIETDGHWVMLTSRNIDDSTLSTMAQSVVRDPDGIALVPDAELLDGLTLVLPSDAPAAYLGLGSDFAGISYGTPDGRSIGLQVYPSKPSPRAMLGLQTSLTPVKVAGADGFSGSYSTEASEPDNDYRVVTWERDGLDFRVSGFHVTDAEMLAAAESAEHVSESKWNEMLRQTGGGLDSGSAAAGTVPAEPAPAGTDPPFTGEVRDVSIDVAVTNPSANEQVWSGALPTGESWKVDVTRVFDSIAMKPEIEGVGQGMSYGPLVRTAGQELGCCGPLSVVTADPNAAAMRVTTHTGERFSIPLHDLPNTDGLRIAAIALPNGSGPRAAELIDADGNVLETLPGGS